MSKIPLTSKNLQKPPIKLSSVAQLPHLFVLAVKLYDVTVTCGSSTWTEPYATSFILCTHVDWTLDLIIVLRVWLSLLFVTSSMYQNKIPPKSNTMFFRGTKRDFQGILPKRNDSIYISFCSFFLLFDDLHILFVVWSFSLGFILVVLFALISNSKVAQT